MNARRRPESHARLIALATLAIGVGSCTDGSSPLNVVPGAPADLVLVAGDEQEGVVAEPLAQPLSVKVYDRFGNPLEGVMVTWEVPDGAAADPAESRTDPAGVARTRWTLGTQAGPQTATALVPGMDPISFEVVARPGPAAGAVAVEGDAQTGIVGEELAAPLVIRVTDGFGNSVPYAPVSWRTAGDAGAIRSEALSDSVGISRASWTLGTTTGEHRAYAYVSDRRVATFTSEAGPGAASSARAVGGEGQVAGIGERLGDPLVARIEDAYGNVVPGVEVTWEVETGTGTLDSVSSVSDDRGEVRARWTLGKEVGTQTTLVGVPEIQPLRFTARAFEGINLTIDAVYLNQSVQRYQGDVPLVAGRPAYLRVFVLSSDTTLHSPEVHVHVYQDGAHVDTRTIAGRGSAPTSVAEGDHLRSWNLLLEGELIRPGLGVVAEVNPGGEVPELSPDDNVFPASGAPLSFDIRAVHPFRATLVPVRLTGFDRAGDVTESNLDAWMRDTRAMFPLVEDQVTIRAPFTTSATALDANGWGTAISEVRALRTADASNDYYYGVLPNVTTSAYCGLGYIAYPTSIGLDACGGSTMAHEFGHNFGRYHAPCGNPSGVDPNFPYSDGGIGVHGYDVFEEVAASPAAYKDLMSYCGPEWISDYNYEAVMAYRAGEAGAAQAVGSAAARSTLLVWGRVGPDGIVLEPSFSVTTQPRLPGRAGPYRLTGYDGGGAPVFSMDFTPEDVGDLPGHKHFAFAVPADEALLASLARIELRGEGRVAARAAGRPSADPGVAASRRGAGRARIQWEASVFSAALVRDAATGQVLGILRRGDGDVVAPGAAVDVVFSDGVRSVERRVPVRN